MKVLSLIDQSAHCPIQYGIDLGDAEPGWADVAVIKVFNITAEEWSWTFQKGTWLREETRVVENVIQAEDIVQSFRAAIFKGATALKAMNQIADALELVSKGRS